MSRAATATLPLQGLPPIPCGAVAGERTEPDAEGRYSVRMCTLPHGHLERDVPHRWAWEAVEPQPVDELGVDF